MRRKIILAILISLAMGIAISCGSSKVKEYKGSFFDTFDTEITYIIYEKSPKRAEEFAKLIKDEFVRLNALYDNYKEYSGVNNLMTINKNAGKQLVKVDKDIIDLLTFTKELELKYKSKNNMAFGSVLNIWHQYRDQATKDPANAKLPPMELLKEASEHTDINKVIINHKESTVFLDDEKMALDLGATSKGYATQIVANKLREKGCLSAIISAGGNIVTIGKPAESGRKTWAIGIQNPDVFKGGNQPQIIDVLYKNDTSVVTSGDYQRFFTVDGKNYNHIIDPETLMPATFFRDVTVVTKDSGLADFMSTTLFLMPFEQGKKLVESIDGMEAQWILPDKSVVQTDGLKPFLKSHGAKDQ